MRDVETGFLVYHAKIEEGKANFMERFSEEKNFELVGEVRTTDVNEAYRLTNHIERDWRENENSIGFVKRPRSTSVGDVLVRVKYETDTVARRITVVLQQVLVVAGCGFEKLNLDTWNAKLGIKEEIEDWYGRMLIWEQRELEEIYEDVA